MVPLLPFSEPSYLAGLPSPSYSHSHLAWQKVCRIFIEENLIHHALDWERQEIVPPEVFQNFAAANMLIPSMPAPLPAQWLKKLGVHNILGVVKVEDWDYIHTAIYIDEVYEFKHYRCCETLLMKDDRWHGVGLRVRWARLPLESRSVSLHCSNMEVNSSSSGSYQIFCWAKKGSALPSRSLMLGLM